MRVAVLVKQVPRFEEMALGDDGRLRRSAVDLELNPYCRRAVSKGVELVREHGGECVVFALGPLAAADALREAVAWGADRAVHLCDSAFAGSDTLATARALATALCREGEFDLVLVGKCSVDADTGQVGPEVAQLLRLPMLAGARELDVQPDRRTVRARCERDDGHVVATTTLPALVSTAERLCEPAKVPPEGRAAVAPGLITCVGAASLGAGPWGVAGSPTSVGELRSHEVIRRKALFSGPLETQIDNLVATLKEHGLLGRGRAQPKDAGDVSPVAATPDTGRRVVVYLEPDRPDVGRELLGQAAARAADIGGRVIALTWEPDLAATYACWGADLVVPLTGSRIEQDVAAALARWCDARRPWALLLPGTMCGREVGGRIAAELQLGLTGDAVDVTVDGEVLVAWKPAFGGQLLAAITSSSDIQMVTVRPGVLPLRAIRLRAASTVLDAPVEVPAQSPTVYVETARDDDVELLSRAEVVLAVGSSVPPECYGELEPLRRVLGAEFGATRKVTDKGWMPRARQVGITGRSISPRLFLSIGASGKFNHVVGARGAHLVVAINNDPNALIFDSSDIGIVGDWREVISLLTEAIAAEVTTAPRDADLRATSSLTNL